MVQAEAEAASALVGEAERQRQLARRAQHAWEATQAADKGSHSARTPHSCICAHTYHCGVCALCVVQAAEKAQSELDGIHAGAPTQETSQAPQCDPCSLRASISD